MQVKETTRTQEVCGDQGGAEAPRLSSAAVAAVVCVPTFCRPDMLARTLASLARQNTSRAFRVVVVDNDAGGREGFGLAAEAFRRGDLSGSVSVEPLQGNCRAINAAFRAARERYPGATYLAMIDDDETAAPDWLERLMTAAERHGADIVGGPVFPVFAGSPARALAEHPVFWPAFHRSGPVPTIYGSGNFLIRREAMTRLEDPEFDVAFNYLGGGDTDFFARCRGAGLTFYWENEARIEETVPQSRSTVGWIVRRGLRIGAINYRLDRRADGSRMGWLRAQAKTLALLPVSLVRATRILLATGSLLQASHPMVIASGRLLGSLGIEPLQYRVSSPP